MLKAHAKSSAESTRTKRKKNNKLSFLTSHCVTLRFLRRQLVRVYTNGVVDESQKTGKFFKGKFNLS